MKFTQTSGIDPLAAEIGQRRMVHKPFQKQTLIITGPACSGKSLLSRFFTQAVSNDHIWRVNGRNINEHKNPHFFSGFTQDVKFIIIDDLKSVTQLPFFLSLATEDIRVIPVGAPEYFVSAGTYQVIINTLIPFREIIKAIKGSEELCHVIDLNQCGYTDRTIS